MSDETVPREGAEGYAIGISFGNSYSSIAHISREGKVEVIANEEGDRQIPSVLSYVDGEEYHGTQAKAQLVRNSKNTIAYFKDYLGKPYKDIDPSPCEASAHPAESGSEVSFEVQEALDGDKTTLSIVDTTTRHIRRLKTSASDYSGRTVTAAVVSAPTDFTEAQKTALIKAAAAAEVRILQFIPEPIAAVLAYDARSNDVPADRVIVVADLGGLRSDVAVVASRGGLYTILATAHDYELGGSKLDEVLMDFFAKEFEKKNKKDPRTSERSLAKLKLEAEAVKKTLSQSQTATATIESLSDGIDFRMTLNRTRYEILASKIFGRFTRLIEDVVRKADLDVLDIDEVIMSGGTSHTPRIATNLQNIFPESTQIQAPATITTSLHPSELSARGAAVQASLIQEFDKEDIDQSTHEMVTVTPHVQNAIGVQVTGDPEGRFHIIVPPASAAPTRRTVTVAAPQGDAVVLLSEVEREIKVTKPEPKAKTNGAKVEDAEDDDDDDDDDDDSEEEEEEDIREKAWKIRKPLAEFAFRSLKKSKIEVSVNIDAQLGMTATAREVGGKTGIRGSTKAPQATANGSA